MLHRHQNCKMYLCLLRGVFALFLPLDCRLFLILCGEDNGVDMVELKTSSVGLHFAALPHAILAQGLPILIEELEAL